MSAQEWRQKENGEKKKRTTYVDRPTHVQSTHTGGAASRQEKVRVA